MKNFFLKKINSGQQGFTLIEMVIYVGLVAIVGTAIGVFTFNIIGIGARVKTNIQVISSARRAIETMAFQIRDSRSVYWPTSIFDANPGQLSLEQTATSTVEVTDFVDFFQCGQGLCQKEQGNDPVNLTGDGVLVKTLLFNYLEHSSSSAAIRITLEIESLAQSGGNPSSQTLVTTIKLRGY
jgi:type II secretory pathway pseudopilin PulG